VIEACIVLLCDAV